MYTKNQTHPNLTFYLQIHLGLRKAVSFDKNVEFLYGSPVCKSVS